MKSSRYFIAFMMSLALFASCDKDYRGQIDRAIRLADTLPDSAMSVLSHVRKVYLDDEDTAKYALAYTWAQDRSGIDVADDSLIRKAYNHYRTTKKDSLFPRCAYYMGKYYMLVDS